MKSCQNCGTATEDNSKFCQSCGKVINQQDYSQQKTPIEIQVISKFI